MNEKIQPKRGTVLRKNTTQDLIVSLNRAVLDNIFIINGSSFITEHITISDIIIKPNDFYMIINNGKNEITIEYSQDISNHKIIYDPYKFENSKKVNLEPDVFIKKYNVPDGYIDTLPKWYSFKFTYPDYNLIFIRPELGISIQNHKYRNEFWNILEGKPIIINGNNVHYFVKKGTKFQNLINMYHSIINPHKDQDKFIVLKERWNGKFDENDIERVFNPNNYV